MAKASFVIATYNRISDLERCIDSILLQEGCLFEILVVDDASPDSTCQVVEEKYGDRVRLVRRETNCGSIRNRNRGAGMAEGDVLFLIDDDTEIPGRTTAAEVLREFEDENIGAVAIPYIQNGALRKSAPANDGKYAVASYVGCASAVRKDVFLDLGGYDEFFHHQVEEDDFCIRMMGRGKICKIARVSEPMLHHESPIRNFYRLDYFGRRNAILYIWKNCPALYIIPNLMVTTLRSILYAFRIRRFRGSLAGLLAGHFDMLKSMFGRGARRRPASRAVYNLTRRLRQSPRPLQEAEQVMAAAKGDRPCRAR